MCIVALAWQIIPNTPLVLLSNRDEFYHRPSQPLAQWANSPIIAGQDLQDGGTWLGITQTGRFAVVTNFRESPMKKGKQSRGQLVTNYLEGNISPMQFANSLQLADYAGFNLIIGDKTQCVVVSNRGTAPTPLPAGLYVLSNGQIDEAWPKVEKLRQAVTQEILPLFIHNENTTAKEQAIEAAFKTLQNQTQAPDAQLPNTGIAIELERALSAIFIKTPIYGTRCSSVVVFNDEGFSFGEQVYAPEIMGRHMIKRDWL